MSCPAEMDYFEKKKKIEADQVRKNIRDYIDDDNKLAPESNNSSEWIHTRIGCQIRDQRMPFLTH